MKRYSLRNAAQYRVLYASAFPFSRGFDGLSTVASVCCLCIVCIRILKGSVSSSIPCTCRLLADLCLSPFSWPMKMATTKAIQETTRVRNAG